MRIAGVSAMTITKWVQRGWLVPAAENVPHGVGRPGRRFHVDELLRVAEERGTIVRDRRDRLVTTRDQTSVDDILARLDVAP